MKKPEAALGLAVTTEHYNLALAEKVKEKGA